MTQHLEIGPQTVQTEALWVRWHKWLDDANRAGAVLPNAMCLSTVSSDGKPSSRMVLMKHSQAGTITFFTDRTSRKAADLASNGHVSMTWWWPQVGRSVRMEGWCEFTDTVTDDDYFSSRPAISQASAMASHQSQPIGSIDDLKQQRDALLKRGNLSRPDRWGGYVVAIQTTELWQDQEGRLHQREEYGRVPGTDTWTRRLLSP